MIVTTTPTVEGYRITGYYGIVFGEVITGINFLKDFGAGIRNLVGGRSAGYEEELMGALLHLRQCLVARRGLGRPRHRRGGYGLRSARPGQHAHGHRLRHRRHRGSGVAGLFTQFGR